MFSSKFTTWWLSGLMVSLTVWLYLDNTGGGPQNHPNSGDRTSAGMAGSFRTPAEASQKSVGQSKHVRTPMEEAIEFGTATPMDMATFWLVEDDGKVSPRALEQSGVGREKLPAIQKLVDGLWTAMSLSMKRRMIGDPDKEGDFFLIPSASGEADDPGPNLRLLQKGCGIVARGCSFSNALRRWENHQGSP